MGDFLRPCAQAHGRGGHVHGDMASHNLVLDRGGMERHVVITARQNHHQHHPRSSRRLSRRIFGGLGVV